MTTAFIAGLGPLELLIVLAIVLVVFGGRKLPELGRNLGEGARGFKDAVSRRSEVGWMEHDDRAETPAPLGHGSSDEQPLDGEVMRERP